MARKTLMESIIERSLCSSAVRAAWLEGRLFLHEAGISLAKTVCLLKTFDTYHSILHQEKVILLYGRSSGNSCCN